MTLEEFRNSTAGGVPPVAPSKALLSLWHAKAGDWESAHRIVQDESTVSCSWVHAWLHRVEGDIVNAEYWYRRAQKRLPDLNIEEEWDAITAALLAESQS
jgi:hypothetical protein